MGLSFSSHGMVPAGRAHVSAASDLANSFSDQSVVDGTLDSYNNSNITHPRSRHLCLQLSIDKTILPGKPTGKLFLLRTYPCVI